MDSVSSDSNNWSVAQRPDTIRTPEQVKIGKRATDSLDTTTSKTSSVSSAIFVDSGPDSEPISLFVDSAPSSNGVDSDPRIIYVNSTSSELSDPTKVTQQLSSKIFNPKTSDSSKEPGNPVMPAEGLTTENLNHATHIQNQVEQQWKLKEGLASLMFNKYEANTTNDTREFSQNDFFNILNKADGLLKEKKMTTEGSIKEGTKTSDFETFSFEADNKINYTISAQKKWSADKDGKQIHRIRFYYISTEDIQEPLRPTSSLTPSPTYIGGGGFGTVRQVSKHTGKKEAAKSYKNPDSVRDDVDAFQKIGKHSHKTLQKGPKSTFLAQWQTRHNTYHVMFSKLYHKDNMKNKLHKGMDATQKLIAFKQVGVAVKYLHSKGLAHCDIKPGNIFYSGDGRTAVLGDLGASRDATTFKTSTTACFMNYEHYQYFGGSGSFKDLQKVDYNMLGYSIYAALIDKPAPDLGNFPNVMRNMSEDELKNDYRIKQLRSKLKEDPDNVIKDNADLIIENLITLIKSDKQKTVEQVEKAFDNITSILGK